ncbi:hypothetical protein CONCODRAFT_6399 [Conidiobolus coronatus NRRL 28638]|uniref:Nudix hydrolase domain-containing protein n=1 Tax=Conidiobolus coronatus (strain ATCC 28846 / CBS 209.66 / NRRL 28638) TaxID=796925 RepID=A0A137P7P7_CONC2|nr:hypothetical protein CONCODRAFT_6399 [Conidiobolus coronatus NRRL 28638]|eukprot:KXN70951.1 hypothetical protein CONCODRAFT_6399 [Conidiobolus coronatus NRRL 28638]
MSDNGSMEENDSKFRIAASLILIQKQVNDDSYEILMMKRSNTTTFKSLTVFPGGAQDKVDSLDYWKQPEDIKLTSLKLTAIRETFEEAGILLTAPQVSLSEVEVKEWREKLEENPQIFIEMCQHYKVSPDVDNLYYVSHWFPPSVVPKKFSTFFFAYLAPNPIAPHQPNTKGSQRELTNLEYKTPSSWIKLQRDQIIFYPPQFYTCSILANSFPTYSSISKHLKTSPKTEPKSMIPQVQVLDDSQIDLKAWGIDSEILSAVYYHIFPGDFQFNGDFEDVDYGPLSASGAKFRKGRNYHRIFGIVEGMNFRDLKLITNMKLNSGRFLVHDSCANNDINMAKL